MELTSFTSIDIIAIALAVAHFSIPLIYYLLAKNKWLRNPWNIKTDENHRAKMTIVIPTYREANLIGRKLNNILAQDYPKDQMDVIVVDSASDDGTVESARKWISDHRDINVDLLRESERKGKAYALNQALKHATGEIIVTADVDASWPRGALKEISKWFADPTVGAVSCLKKPVSSSSANIEEDYRHYYNVLRLAESKAYATPIFHGELAAFRKSLLEDLGGFPTDIGADDSYTALRIASMGFRAIIPEHLWVEETVPKKGYSLWRVRRAQHLIQHFTKSVEAKNGAHPEFGRILLIESFLHLINPWLLLTSALLLIASIAIFGSTLAMVIASVGLILLGIGEYRMWIVQQLYVMIGTIRNLWNKEVVWSKQIK